MGKKIELSVMDITTQDGEEGILWRGEFYPKVEVQSCTRTVRRSNWMPQFTGVPPGEYIDCIRRDTEAVREKIKERCQGGDEGVLLPITLIPQEDGYIVTSLIVPLPEGFDIEEFRNQKLP